MAFNPDRKFVQRSFFQEGMTTKKEILDRLGKPVAQYEEGRIITYWAEHDRKDRFRVVETLGTGNTILVIVFRNDGVLERYSVVTRR